MKYYADVENAEIHEMPDEKAAMADETDREFICDTRYDAKVLCLVHAKQNLIKAKQLRHKARQL